jgi:hypothetical protein
MIRTKVVAFADDLILAIKGESVRVIENYANIELSKLTLWSKNNEIKFNEEKSKAILVTRWKRREQWKTKVYSNNKPLEQVIRMKYLGIIIAHKFRFQEHIICCRKMHKTYLQLIKNGKIVLGNLTCSD